jgi:hypothetical protein
VGGLRVCRVGDGDEAAAGDERGECEEAWGGGARAGPEMGT